MSSLLNKISTLLRARIEAFLDEELRLSSGPGRRELLSASQLGKDVDREIEALRRRIDEAITHEEKLQEEIDALRQEAADWDLRADNALLAGDEAAARHAVMQMQHAERSAAFKEADLVQHRRSTAEFIERVNMLEGLVAEARNRQEEPAAAPPSATLDTVLQSTRQEAEKLEDAGQAPTPEGQPAQDTAPAEDDLVARRARLARHNPSE